MEVPHTKNVMAITKKRFYPRALNVISARLEGIREARLLERQRCGRLQRSFEKNSRRARVRPCRAYGAFPAKLTQNVLIASSAGRNNPLLVLDRFASLGFRRGGRLGRVRGSHETRCLVPTIPSPLQQPSLRRLRVC
jgi:hypothetical protein